jgi:hypothetical protein
LKLAEVQQACTIIQSAAHEDANIIFGAVMDEKMKDAVKITVIATGFREVRGARHRPQETHISFASSHEEAMDFPDGSGRREDMPEPERIMSESGNSDRGMSDERIDDRSYGDDGASAGRSSDRMAGDIISLDTMRSSVLPNMVANFESDDLDVPAFLRKRNEVM